MGAAVAVELTVLVGLAAYRASRLLGRDTLFDGWRHRFYRWFPPNEIYRRHYRIVTPDAKNQRRKTWQVSDRPMRKTSWWGKLVDCPWCSSVWLAAGIVAVTTRYASVPMPVLVWAAACSVAGLCARIDS